MEESKTREKAARKEQWTGKIPKPLKSPWKGQFSQDISQLSLSTRTYNWEGFGVQSNSESTEGWTWADISPETRTSLTLSLFSCSRLVWQRPFWPQFAFPLFLMISLSNNPHYYNLAETSKSYLKFLQQEWEFSSTTKMQTDSTALFCSQWRDGLETTKCLDTLWDGCYRDFMHREERVIHTPLSTLAHLRAQIKIIETQVLKPSNKWLYTEQEGHQPLLQVCRPPTPAQTSRSQHCVCSCVSARPAL